LWRAGLGLWLAPRQQGDSFAVKQLAVSENSRIQQIRRFFAADIPFAWGKNADV
jgi:hypothetical protein